MIPNYGLSAWANHLTKFSHLDHLDWSEDKLLKFTPSSSLNLLNWPDIFLNVPMVQQKTFCEKLRKWFGQLIPWIPINENQSIIPACSFHTWLRRNPKIPSHTTPDQKMTLNSVLQCVWRDLGPISLFSLNPTEIFDSFLSISLENFKWSVIPNVLCAI